MNNPVVRWQVITPDPEQSSSFFGHLFGWQTDRGNALGYREVRAGDGGFHGGIWPAPDGVKPFIQLFVKVEDLDACLQKATALGAKVIVPKTALPDGNEMAVFLEPQGLPVAICTR